MYITINNEKYELTIENIMELNRQEAIETARNAINYFDVNEAEVEKLTDNDLFAIGELITYRINTNTGTIEFDVLEQYGLIKED